MGFTNTAALLHGRSKRLEQYGALVVSLSAPLSQTHTHNWVHTHTVSREYSWLISSLHLGNVRLSPFCKSNILIYLLTSNHLLYIETPFTSGIKLCTGSDFDQTYLNRVMIYWAPAVVFEESLLRLLESIWRPIPDKILIPKHLQCFLLYLRSGLFNTKT